MGNPKPIVVVSKCLGFEACRYNGEKLSDPLIDMLKPYVDFITVCPEMEIGLGVPRNPIRIIKDGKTERLYQPATERDITDKMTSFSRNFLNGLGAVDGFILKFRSPSCGLKGVKIYPKTAKSGSFGNTNGFFGGEVLKLFPLHAVEDEGRLKDFTIREHFLTRLFAIASLRNLTKNTSMGKLVSFHSINKFLLMAYSQKEMRTLGKIVANHERLSIKDVISSYRALFLKAFEKTARPTNCINVLMHGLGFFSKKMSSHEKKYFLEMLEKYRDKKVPLSVPVSILKSYIIRFDERYLIDQTFFSPYPEDLISVTDSGKGREVGR